MTYILRKVLDRKVLLSVLLGAVFGAVLLVISVSAYSLYTQATGGSGDVAVADQPCTPAICDSHGCQTVNKGESWCESTQQCHPAGKDCPAGGGGAQNPPPASNPTCVPNKKAGDACLPSCGDNACDGPSKPLSCRVCPGSTNAAGQNRCMDQTKTDAIIGACGGNKQTTTPPVAPPPTSTPSTPVVDPLACDTSNPSNHPSCKTTNDGVPGVCKCQKTPGTNVCACVGLGNRETSESCSSNTNCKSGNCVAGICQPSGQKAGEGGDCNYANDCAVGGSSCTDHKCVSPISTPSTPTIAAKQIVCNSQMGLCYTEGDEDVASQVVGTAKSIPSKKDLKHVVRDPQRTGEIRFDVVTPSLGDASAIKAGEACRNGSGYFPEGSICDNNFAMCTLADTSNLEMTYCINPDGEPAAVELGGICSIDQGMSARTCASGYGVCTLQGNFYRCTATVHPGLRIDLLSPGQICPPSMLGQQCGQSVSDGAVRTCQAINGSVYCSLLQYPDDTIMSTQDTVAQYNSSLSYGATCLSTPSVHDQDCSGDSGSCQLISYGAIDRSNSLVCIPKDYGFAGYEHVDNFPVSFSSSMVTRPGTLCDTENSRSFDQCAENGGLCVEVHMERPSGIRALAYCMLNNYDDYTNAAVNVPIGATCPEILRGSGPVYSCAGGNGKCEYTDGIDFICVANHN